MEIEMGVITNMDMGNPWKSTVFEQHIIYYPKNDVVVNRGYSANFGRAWNPNTTPTCFQPPANSGQTHAGDIPKRL
jgi:hypothetical protein